MDYVFYLPIQRVIEMNLKVIVYHFNGLISLKGKKEDIN